MKLLIEDIPGWRWRTYKYRVTSLEMEDILWGGNPKAAPNPPQQYVKINNLFDLNRNLGTILKPNYHPNLNHIRQDIREWLNSLPYDKWSYEHPNEFGNRCGLLFSRKQDVVMFKLAWGGRD